jgi:hypothetical protein
MGRTDKGSLVLTVLASEPLDSSKEAEVELRRPSEARILWADVGANGSAVIALVIPAGIHRAAIGWAPIAPVIRSINILAITARRQLILGARKASASFLRGIIVYQAS